MKNSRMIQIQLPITCHRPGPAYKPGHWDKDLGAFVGGIYDIRQIPPWTTFAIEEQEGRRMVERHGGTVVSEKAIIEPHSEREFEEGIPRGVILADTKPVITGPEEAPAKRGRGRPRMSGSAASTISTMESPQAAADFGA